MTACQNKKYAIAMELLRDGRADPNIGDSRGRTPLWMAASGESPSIFIGILVMSSGEVDTEKTPEGQKYEPKFRRIIAEYKKDRGAFIRKYGKDFLGTTEQNGECPSLPLFYFYFLVIA
jgi:hypothetical protein